MDKNNPIYSLSQSLVTDNENLKEQIKYIDGSGLETLIRNTSRIVVFKWESVELIITIIKKKLNSHSQFLCVDNGLNNKNRYQLSSNGIKFISVENFSSLSKKDFFTWSDHEHYKVMIVADHIKQSEHYSSTLEKSGILTKSIHPDIEILESIKQYQPNLLLMLLNIDEIAADEFVKLIRSDSELLVLPIIFITQEISQEARQLVIDVGADDVLLETISDPELTAKLIDRMQIDFLHSLNISENKNLNKFNTHSIKDDEHENLVKFIAEAQDNKDATVIWISIHNKVAIQKKVGLSGFKNLCNNLLKKLPKYQIDFLIQGQIAEGVFVFASDDLTRKQASYWLENINNWLTKNSFSIRNKECRINSKAFVLSDIPRKSNNELLTYEAERLLFNSKSNQFITYISEGEDQRHFYLIKTKLENAIKARDFKWLYQSIVSIKDDTQEIFQLMLKVLSNDGSELRSHDYINIANQTGLLRLLDRYTLEYAIKLIFLGKKQNIHRRILINQLISDYESEQYRQSILNQIKKQKLPEGNLIFQFRQDLTEEHTSLLSQVGKELRQANITICLSEFDASPMAWNIAKTLDVNWLRIKPFGMHHQSPDTKNIDDIAHIINKAHKLGYKVMVTNIESANVTANIWKLNADYIHGNFIQSPVSDIQFIEGGVSS
ncbi:MAG: EAL domain-containing protein [Marinicellaceae bacterium]